MTTQTKTTWREVKLGDIADLNMGQSPKSEFYNDRGEGLPFFQGVKDFGERKPAETMYCSKSTKIVEPGDVLISVRAPVGDVNIAEKKSCIGRGVAGIRAKDKNNEFLYYLLLNFKDYIRSYSGGTTYESINKDALRDLEFVVPQNSTTRRQIADVLSAYDDLIENNTKRIKILEQIAQAIYKEWFVKPVSNGKLPNGWEISTLGEHLIELESGSRPRGGVGEVKKGVPSVGAENINGIGQHNHNSEKYIDKKFFEKMKRGVVQDRDVALYKDGAYIGRTSYFRDEFPHKNFAVNEHVFLLRSSGERVTQNFLYLWLQEPDTIHEIRATNANAAQPGINQPGVRGLKIILPPQKIVETFDAKVEPMFASLINLAKQNNELRQARDLLLPKLVTGEINV